MTINSWGTAEPVAEADGGTKQTSYAKGDILYASASNTLSKLAVGSDNQVCTLAAGIPSWATSAGGTGDWVPLSQATASASSTLTFDSSIITSTYGAYAIVFHAIESSAGSHLQLQLSPDNGSTVRATGYAISTYLMSSTTRGSVTTSIRLTHASQVASSSDANFTGMVFMANAADSGIETVVSGMTGYDDGTNQNSVWLHGRYDTAETHNHVTISFSSGNITSGTVYVCGVNAS